MNYKLGKLPAKIDVRTLKLKSIFIDKKYMTVPPFYDFDNIHQTIIPSNMYANDSVGCCVIATRANHTLRFEFKEQKYNLPITTQIVLDEYYKEQGYVGSKCWLMSLLIKKPDNGLILLDSLNKWRKVGWNLNGNQYTIYAFASVNKNNIEEVKQATFYLCGIQAGVKITQTAMNQFAKGEQWNIINDGNVIGGHCIYIVGYNEIGPICVTWAKKQQMTWAWWNTYVDEAYAIVDNRNSWQSNSVIDIELLDQYLHTITGTSV
jgi:hypothetical protein